MKDFDVIDVVNTPGGMEQLKAMGVRNVPLVAIGDRYTFAQNLKDVARFLGVSLNREQLPPSVLVPRYDSILATAQRLVRQVPVDRMGERVIPNRPRLIRPFVYHIFRIGESFLIAYNGAEYSNMLANAEPPVEIQTPEQVVAYGQQVRDQLSAWWTSNTDRALEKKLDTYYGVQTAHDVFERTTWHSAQHCRQLAVVLERFGIDPDQPLQPQQTAGLPLPEGLWE
ncbi:MAG: DinB family protein [Betaproteobacteria bacterium]|nr:MAG: DinB family protein [Betaproteobacteria bacterium]